MNQRRGQNGWISTRAALVMVAFVLAVAGWFSVRAWVAGDAEGDQRVTDMCVALSVDDGSDC